MTTSNPPTRPGTPIQKPAAPTRPTPTHPPKKATAADDRIFAEADRIHADFSSPQPPELKFVAGERRLVGQVVARTRIPGYRYGPGKANGT